MNELIRMNITRLLVCLVVVLLVSGCRAGSPWVEVAGERYFVEIADDPESRARGLMFRDELARDRGMLFIWSQAEPRAFWMRNTRIALDIVYIGPDHRIVAWSLDTPPCRTRNCPNYPSGRPAQYVLEVRAGEMERIGAGIGDPVQFGNIEGLAAAAASR